MCCNVPRKSIASARRIGLLGSGIRPFLIALARSVTRFSLSCHRELKVGQKVLNDAFVYVIMRVYEWKPIQSELLGVMGGNDEWCVYVYL